MKLVRERIDEKFIEKSDPIKDMGIGPQWKVIFYEYGDDEVVVNEKFNTEDEAQKYVDSCEYEYQDIGVDDEGNDTWLTVTRWCNPEDKETYFGYDIRKINN